MKLSKGYNSDSHEQLNGDDEEDDDIEEELENISSSDSDSDSEGKGQYLMGILKDLHFSHLMEIFMLFHILITQI